MICSIAFLTVICDEQSGKRLGCVLHSVNEAIYQNFNCGIAEPKGLLRLHDSKEAGRNVNKAIHRVNTEVLNSTY